MSNHMRMIRCYTIVVDRHLVPDTPLAQPLAVVIALPDSTQEKALVMASVRQVVCITCLQVSRCIRHSVSTVALYALQVNIRFEFHT